MRGIHHVTAIAGKPAPNRVFYAQTLGLRFVKKTVNFDDPGTYHFYYGDEAGHPGTILTFFPWEHAAPGRGGLHLAETTAFRVPVTALPYWRRRLAEKGVEPTAPGERFGEPIVSFSDPDGMRLALIGVNDSEGERPWSGAGIPAEHAIRGFHGVTLLLEEARATGAILTDVLGFREVGREGPHIRYRADHALGGVVDIHEGKGLEPGTMGRGSVHHVAFRAANDAEQAAMAAKLVKNHRLHPTEQKDRQYFRSIYFREPGGILFEVATDDPGFTVDEPLASLGAELKLPRFLEARRAQLEAILPALEPVA